MKTRSLLLAGLIPLLCTSAANIAATLPADDSIHQVGVAKIDITPEYPVRLSGYGNRREESEGVEQRIWAKALAFGSDAEGAAVLVTVDNCGVPESVRDEVAARLAKTRGLSPARW